MTTYPVSGMPNATASAFTRDVPSVPRTWATRLWRALIFTCVFSVIFIPEFARDGISNTGSLIYAKAIAGFRVIDIALLLLVVCHLVAVGCLRQSTVYFP